MRRFWAWRTSRPKFCEDVADLGQFFFFVGVGGKLVAGGALEELELADVARERRLRDVDATGGELAAELVLVGDGGCAVGGGGLGQEVLDRVLALKFHCKFIQIAP